MTTAPTHGIIVSEYVSFTSRCCTLVPKICVRPEMLHVFQSIDVLTCVIYNCMHSTEKQERLELLVSAMKIIDEDRLVNAQTRYKRIQLTETVELYLPGNLPTRLQCELKTTNELAVLLFCKCTSSALITVSYDKVHI